MHILDVDVIPDGVIVADVRQLPFADNGVLLVIARPDRSNDIVVGNRHRRTVVFLVSEKQSVQIERVVIFDSGLNSVRACVVFQVIIQCTAVSITTGINSSSECNSRNLQFAVGQQEC